MPTVAIVVEYWSGREYRFVNLNRVLYELLHTFAVPTFAVGLVGRRYKAATTTVPPSLVRPGEEVARASGTHHTLLVANSSRRYLRTVGSRSRCEKILQVGTASAPTS